MIISPDLSAGALDRASQQAERDGTTAVSVVVTTFRRTDRLANCLAGLRAQTCPPGEVLVVVHDEDDASARLVNRVRAAWPAVRCVPTERHGLVAACNAGLAASREPIVAYIDDDAVPTPRWVEAVGDAFARDPKIGAVGGRDLVIVNGRLATTGRRPGLQRLLGPPKVGQLQWFGRMLGNHHIGAGPPRDVDVLKGVNMAFRRAVVESIGFDERLRGEGVEVHSELSICLPLRAQGYRIVYDPAIVVEHYPAPRRYGFGREEIAGSAMATAAHNEALEILDYFGPLQRGVFALWGIVFGATHAPGLVVLGRDLLIGAPAAWPRFTAAQRGRLAAWRTRRTERPLPGSSNGVAVRDPGAPVRSFEFVGGGARVSVVVSTYRRPDRVRACLHGLRAQRRPASEVIVVVHADDSESATVVEALGRDWPALRCVRVARHGSVAAYNSGLAAAREEIVAYIDDDAVPSPEWLERLVETFGEDQRIAAVGGRDLVVVDGKIETDGRRGAVRKILGPPTVGRVQWFGRMLGNHHIGEGEPRDVDVLKGVNMAFRREAVAECGFDERLRGAGTQIHSELSICLPLRRRRLRLVYDPSITVMHYPAPRRHGADRNSTAEMVSSAHNEALELLDHFGPTRRLVFAAWSFAVGATHAPGVAVLVRDLLSRDRAAWSRFSAAQQGRAAAWKTRRTTRSTVKAGS